MGRGILAFLLGASVLLAQPTASGDTKKAKAYLKEVKKHLLESYIECEKMSDEKLVETGLKALGAAIDRKEYKDLDEETRAAMKKAVKAADSLDAALDGVAEALGDAKFDFIKFADFAAAAMVKSTGDPFSRILTAEEFGKFLKMMQGGGREDAIGLMLQARDGKVFVYYVQYGYPAYDDGIEMGDEVVSLNGEAAAGKTQDALNELVKVKPGESLSLRIKREGHKKEYDFKLVQRKVQSKDVRFAYLGEGVGYLRLTIFDINLAGEVKKGLKELKDAGMKALILDLRHNPGGALPAATAVANLLLPPGLVIATTESHYTPSLGGLSLPGMGGDQVYKTKGKSEYAEVPMVCLVNGASASASEFLCGALQDHKRAKLIGEKTYGKGVGQSPIFLQSVFQQRYLYLTVMRYRLPGGRDIHHKGVPPDIEFKEEALTPAQFEAAYALRAGGKLAKYIDSRWEEQGDLFRKLADNDRFEFASYPSFEDLHKSLKTSLTKDQVRSELRRAIRRKMADDEGKVWVYDLEADLQLQRALVEVLDLLEGKR